MLRDSQLCLSLLDLTMARLGSLGLGVGGVVEPGERLLVIARALSAAKPETRNPKPETLTLEP